MNVSRRLWIVIVSVIVLISAPLAAQTTPPAETPPADPGEDPLADPKLAPPVLKNNVQPTYPEDAEANGIGAEVVLDIDIDALGKVEAARVTVGATPSGLGFDEAAVAAAQKLEFVPAKLGDQVVAVTISYRFRFVPDVKKEAPPTQTDKVVVPPPTIKAVGELAGELSERGTRLPIVGAKVTVFRGEGDNAEGFETDTDEDGRFRFEGLGVGKWRLLADPEGYYPLRVTEEVKRDKRIRAFYRIERRSYNEYDVTVRTDKVQREVSHTSIDARQAERIPGTFGDVLAVVQNFPGVARTDGSQVVVRGSAPEDSQVYVDGIDVPLIYHFGGLRSVLPVGMVERIDFYPGNFSVEYGRATGGIIDVDLKDLNPKKVGGYADVSILDTSLYLEVPITDNLSVAGAIRRSYIDLLLAPILPDDGTKITLPRYHDGQLLLSYRPDPAHHFETFFFYSNDRFEVLFEDPVANPKEITVTDINFKVAFYRAIASYRYVPSPRLANELKLSIGHDRTDFNIGKDFRILLKTIQGQLRETATFKLSDEVSLRAGIDYLLVRNDYNFRFPDEDAVPDGGPIDTDATTNASFADTKGIAHSGAAFVHADISPFEGFDVAAGVRLDYFSRTKKLSPQPRLTSRFKLHEQWTLEAGVGLFTQEADFFESDKDLGNPDLDVEKAVHYSLGFEFKPRDNIKLEVTGFYKTLHDLVVDTDDAAMRDGELVPLRVDNQGTGRVVGMEVSARHELANNFFGFLAYTFSRSERKERDDPTYRLFDFDQTHILTMVGSYKLPRSWEVGARFRLVSGNLYTPFTGGVYDSDADSYRPVSGAQNSARLGVFNQIDFRIDKKWIYDGWMLNAYLDIQNVTDRVNPESVEYNFDFSETTTSGSGLPIVPVLGLRGEF